VLYGAGLALPLLIYGGFIGLVIIGVAAPGSPAYPHPPTWLVDVTGLTPGLRALVCAAPAALALILYIAWNSGHGQEREGLASVAFPAICLVLVLVLSWLTIVWFGKLGAGWTYLCLARHLDPVPDLALRRQRQLHPSALPRPDEQGLPVRSEDLRP